jgi:hypothetical protein
MFHRKLAIVALISVSCVVLTTLGIRGTRVAAQQQAAPAAQQDLSDASTKPDLTNRNIRHVEVLDVDPKSFRENVGRNRGQAYGLFVANKSPNWVITGISINGGAYQMLDNPIGQTCTEACANCLKPPKSRLIFVTDCSASAYTYKFMVRKGTTIAASSEGTCHPDCTYAGETTCFDPHE